MNKTLSRVAACTAAGFATALVASATMFGATAHAATGDVALYRLYSANQGDHFYTTSAAERDFAVAHFGYRAEGVTGYVGTQSAAGRTALYRLYSKAAGDHFYTTNAAERDFAVSAFGYVNEGVAGYVGTAADASDTPLYRSYSAGAGDHFYTTSAAEKDAAVSKLAYRDEGVMGYVYNDGTSQPVGGTGTPTGPTTPADPTKFDKVRISLTFDDGWKSIRQNGLPVLQKYGLTSTHYINSQPTLGNYSGYNTSADIKAIYDAGNEIAWHTNTHTYDLTTATPAQLTAEVTPDPSFLSLLASIGVPLSDNFAAPFGTVSPTSVAAVTAAGFHSYRTTNDGYNTKANFDANNILVKNICGADGLDACNEHNLPLAQVKATTPADISRWIDEAKANNAWLVIVYHEVGDFTRAQATANNRLASCDNDPTDAGADQNACVVDPSYAVTPENLDAELKIISDAKASGSVLVQTVKQALTELRAQITK